MDYQSIYDNLYKLEFGKPKDFDKAIKCDSKSY